MQSSRWVFRLWLRNTKSLNTQRRRGRIRTSNSRHTISGPKTTSSWIGTPWDCSTNIWKWFCSLGEKGKLFRCKCFSNNFSFRFCTLFVVAFPLGPFFALVNNIFELRLDARKFLLYYKRPVPRRVSDIGIWLGVMSMLGRLSVITTAFISMSMSKRYLDILLTIFLIISVAFSSNFIPRLVHDHSQALKNIDYLEFTLAYFDTKDFDIDSKPNNTIEEYDICRYPEFRNGPNHEHPYKRPHYYYQVTQPDEVS